MYHNKLLKKNKPKNIKVSYVTPNIFVALKHFFENPIYFKKTEMIPVMDTEKDEIVEAEEADTDEEPSKMEDDDENTSNQKQFVINILQGFSGTIGFIFIFANIIYQLK
jgi:hypothetical protein